MTAAGAATVAFIAVLLMIYGLWSSLAWQYQKGRDDWQYSDPWYAAISWVTWIGVHAVVLVLIVIDTMLWLGRVAGWWS